MAHTPVLTSQQQSAFNSALLTGIQEKNMDMIKLALDNGAEPNVLMFAGINYKPTWGDKFNYANPFQTGLEWIKAAVEAGADVNAKKHGGGDADWPAIHWAEDNFNEEISSFLLEKGVSVDTPSPSGNTPLMRAVGKGSEALVRFYLNKGADPMCPCGEKKDSFPLRELQGSNDFKKNVKSQLLMLMMQHTKKPEDAPAESAPAKTDSGVALSQDIEVSRPVELKHAEPPKPGKSFTI